MKKLCVAFILALCSLQGVNAAPLLRGRCHMDTCYWVSIEQNKIIKKTPNESLHYIISKEWSSYHKNGNYDKKTKRVSEGQATFWFLCSMTRPAYIRKQGHKFEIQYLYPTQPIATLETITTMYLSACHNAYDKKTDSAYIAEEMGYQDMDEKDEETINKPEDILP